MRTGAPARTPAEARGTGSPGWDDEILRVTPNDLTTLLSDRGPAPMNIAAVLVVDGGSTLDRSAVTAVLARGVARVPRLRQRLCTAPLGCGRPYWLDDEDLGLGRHVLFERVGREADLWRRVAELVCRPLPRDRPLWAAHWIVGLPEDRGALVFISHHVLTDGIGGLAVLAALTDAGPTSAAATGDATDLTTRAVPSGPGRSRTAPSRQALAADAWHGRLQAAVSVGPRLRLVRSGLRDLGVRAARPRLCPATSLNRPTGDRRQVCVLDTPLTAVIAAAHRHQATLNDLLLTAVSGAIGGALADDGQRPDSVVLSVPYSSRAATTAGSLGNATGVVPFRIPLDSDALTRLRSVVQLTRQQHGRPRAASAGPLGVAFRGLARVGLLQWFVDHQRLVNSFVTNVHGPDAALRFCGCAVTRLVPIAVTPGNVAVSFVALSYAGTLAISVVTDPEVVADSGPLVAHLREELDVLLC
ncbi:wax ester/triacylglycerol synthase domain-containing protein [Terrabacter sp. 2RAF25]|uniref:wax ester/triacylglycerol synthase domain-containing protein n=1 Tax=Terrabacter sp. 2RAF25 TaxID=3232998 RepID=UPI003F963917